MICNSHIDPIWQWNWDEGAATALAKFRTVADLCEEFEPFVFCHNESVLKHGDRQIVSFFFGKLDPSILLVLGARVTWPETKEAGNEDSTDCSGWRGLLSHHLTAMPGEVFQ